MNRTPCWIGIVLLAAAALVLLSGADASRIEQDRIGRLRNLGKAFYENPTTQAQAVDEFKKALDLAPNSAREHLNYGLALLRAGKNDEGVAELQRAQKLDPTIPHTWFNLGIVFKKEGEYATAVAQFEGMLRLVPDEPVSHYSLGVLHKLADKRNDAIREFETAERLNSNLAGPHFQLYNLYRQTGRAADAARELETFQKIKVLTENAAVPEDMEWSYYAEIYDPIAPRPEGEPAPPPKFDDRKVADGFDPATAGLLVLDAFGDRRPSLLAWSSHGAQLYRNGTTLVPDSGLAGLTNIVSIAAGDYDNDGLPDLCVITTGGAALYHNNKGNFEKSPLKLPAGHFAKAVWLDFDHDYDLDLILLGENAALARNNGEAGFSDETAAFPFVQGTAIDAAAIDLIADTNGVDLAVSYSDRAGVLYRDRLLGKYAAEPLDTLPAGAKGLAAYDVNNDGWTDLAADGLLLLNHQGKLQPFAGLEAKGPLTFADLDNRGIGDLVAANGVFRNLGLDHFEKMATSIPPAVAAVESDFGGAGRADVALITEDGSLHLLHNTTETKNNWLLAGLNGVKNPKLAPYTKIEIKTGARYQKRIYRGVPLLFGVDSYKSADDVRITWPNGTIQNESEQPVDKAIDYQEQQRLSGSCPMIFTWDGRKFRFITDVLGVAPLGAASGDGSYFPVDHDEYVQIPGDALQAVNGRYEIRITEELREVSYLDQVKLIAVDHPAALEIFTNDKFKSPPFPEFRLFGVERRIYPTRARDSEGRDVLARLLHRDRTYPDGFRRDYLDVAELHTLDLDFGKAAPNNRAVLILNGWVDWADGSTFRAAAQAKKDLVLPYLQVKDAAGRWQTVIQDMGIPAGKPKTIAVDLTGKFLSDSREVRIVTNLCVYWDEIFLSDETAAPSGRLTEIPAAAASLDFRGFSTPVIHPQRKQPEGFDYAQWMPVSMWNPTRGLYTRYGDVLPLIGAIDDRLVIMGSGDELRLFFPESATRPLPAGWKRDFLLFVDGWAKDADANTAFGQTVEPLPFHAMSQYPYAPGEHFPDDPAHQQYRKEYNTRPALRLIRPLAKRSLTVAAR
ncbi:MAG TPA: FG-GAP-like repeat-containing protein [Bryobacteraceae bacterium]|jgi:Flp pilus assembly protein TadD|nr:FG-GAP-like repeat-containing protein [Bryobacteraceae bacterium]